jgi:hypothetical protein
MAGSVSGPVGIRGILFIGEKMKKAEFFFDFRSGCVTNWYQSMVTTLGLLGLMNELRRDSIRSTVKRSNSLS